MRLEIGDPLPAFALPFAGSRTVEHSTWAGRPLLVVFTCNHCPTVQAYEARLQALVEAHASPTGLPKPGRADYSGRLAVVGIHSNDPERTPQDAFERTLERFRAGEINYVCAHDADQEVARAFGAERTPEFFLFGRGATLAYRGALDDNPDADAATRPYLEEAIGAVLEGVPPPVAETPAVGCTIKWAA